MSADEDTLERLHADMVHLASACRKRGQKELKVAEQLEWCAAELAKVKEARDG